MGRRPLNLARALAAAGLPIIGTSVDTIEEAEDREKFRELLDRLNLKQPASGIARTLEQRVRKFPGSVFRPWSVQALFLVVEQWKFVMTNLSLKDLWLRHS